MACGAFLTTFGAVIYFHYSQIWLLLTGLLVVALCMFV
jgi:hypothetical protein